MGKKPAPARLGKDLIKSLRVRPGELAELAVRPTSGQDALAGLRRSPGPGPLRRRAGRRAGTALRHGEPGAADRLPGDGRGRQGRRHQARAVRRQPAGLLRRVVQAAVAGGARARLPLAGRGPPAGARRDRDLQPLLLRGRPGRPRPPGAARPAARGTVPAQLPRLWEHRYRGHPRFRAPPAPQRHADRQDLPAPVQGRAAPAAAGPARRPGPELEVLPADLAERVLGPVPGRLRGRAVRDLDQGRSLVRHSPPTTSLPARVLVAGVIVDAIARLHLSMPVLPPEKKSGLEAARQQLQAEQARRA